MHAYTPSIHLVKEGRASLEGHDAIQLGCEMDELYVILKERCQNTNLSQRGIHIRFPLPQRALAHPPKSQAHSCAHMRVLIDSRTRPCAPTRSFSRSLVGLRAHSRATHAFICSPNPHAQTNSCIYPASVIDPPTCSLTSSLRMTARLTG